MSRRGQSTKSVGTFGLFGNLADLKMNLFDELKQNIATETLCAQATIVSGSRVGAKMIIYPDARVSGDLGDPGLTAQVAQDARKLMRRDNE